MTGPATRPIRLHPPLLKEVQHGLTAVFNDNVPINKFLLTVRRNRKFGSRDRRFITEHLYDIVRYRRMFSAVYQKAPPAMLHRYAAYLVMNLLRTGKPVANLEVALDTEIALADRWRDLLSTADQWADERTRHSFTDWMWGQGQDDYGKAWTEIAASLNDDPVTYLRLNTLRTTPEDLEDWLRQKEITYHRIDGTDAYEIITRTNITNEPVYKKGWFEFQGLASQHVAIMADLSEDMTVLDACAGAGGKTLHLAALMNNTGNLIAADKDSRRLKQLQFRAQRAGVTNMTMIDFTELDTLSNKMDRVILDAPCTATGTIWRKPEIKWKTSAGSMSDYVRIQLALIEQGANWVRQRGMLVYATCSVFKKEGEEVVAEFLAANEAFQLVSERRFLPSTDRTDGFYIAVLSRSA